MQDIGAGEILLTSKDRDGTKDGYDIPVTKAIAESRGYSCVGHPAASGRGCICGVRSPIRPIISSHGLGYLCRTPHHDLIVDSLPQLNSVDCNYFILLINLIKHPVLSFSDSIPVPPSSQLRNTLWKGVVSQPLNLSIDSDVRLIIEEHRDPSLRSS